MSRNSIIVNISIVEDIKKITEDTKYINFCIDSVNNDIIDYFILNGKNFFYSDNINDKNGFMYTDYETFKLGESIIDDIIDNMPINLNKLEICRYIYVTLGKIFSTDINAMDNKSETISFNNISMINNIWGALSKGKICDSIVSKIFLYVCTRLDIKCELVSKDSTANKVYIDNMVLIVDLFNDIPNIQGRFCTHYFDKFNNNKEIDKKIYYIKDEYMDYYLENIFNGFDYNENDLLYNILTLTNCVINVKSLGTFELFKIYRDIFKKYIPNYCIKINNLFINNGFNYKEHFIVFNYNDKYYSFNYNKNYFVNIDEDILYNNIKSNKIGVYENEEFELVEKRVIL